MDKEQIKRAIAYHIKKESECHPNVPELNKYHLKRIGNLSVLLSEME